MRRLAPLFAVLFGLLGVQFAFAQHLPRTDERYQHANFFPLSNLGTNPLGACNGYAVSGDGCSGAPTANAYTTQVSNFFPTIVGGVQTAGAAQQSGESYVTTGGCGGSATNNPAVCHPPWAVAGVDYPVGPNASAVASFGVPGGSADPTVSANLPSGCTFSAVTYLVTCTSGSSTLNLGPFDWSAAGNAYNVDIGFNIVGTITNPCVIHDNNFVFDIAKSGASYPSVYGISGCSTITAVNNSFKIRNSSTSTTGTFGTSSFQALFSTNQNSSAALLARVTTVEYNYFQACPARCVTPSNLLMKYNYIAGFQMFAAQNGTHGDGWNSAFDDQACSCSGITSQEEQYDTWLVPANSAGQITCIACGTVDLAASSATFITNSGSNQLDVVLASGSASTISPQTNSFTAGISGTTMTVASGGITGTIYPGTTITGSGVTANTIITANGTGTGGAGTYTVSPSQTVSTGTAISGAYGLLTVGGTIVNGTACCGFQVGGNQATLAGSGVTTGTSIYEDLTGAGGAGTYAVSPSQTVASTTITIGAITSPGPQLGQGAYQSSGLTAYGGLGSLVPPFNGPSIVACPGGSCSQEGGQYTMSEPWISYFTGVVGPAYGNIYAPFTVAQHIVDHNVFVVNAAQTLAGCPGGTANCGMESVLLENQAYFAQATNNYFDSCGLTGNPTVTMPCVPQTDPTVTDGGSRSTYVEGNNVQMNNGTCFTLYSSSPETCGVTTTYNAPVVAFSPGADTNALVDGITLKPSGTPSITQGAKFSGTAGTVTMGASPTVGDAIIASFEVNNGSTSPPATVTCTDNATGGSNTYTNELTNLLGGASDLWSYVFVAPLTRTNAGSFVVTCTATGAVSQTTLAEEATNVATGGGHTTNPTDLYGEFYFGNPTGAANNAITPQWSRKVLNDLVWGAYFGSVSSMTYGTSPFTMTAGPVATQGSGVFTENAVQ